MNPIVSTSPFTWTGDAQRRAHGLAVRDTYARRAPVKIKIVSCEVCHLVHPGAC